MGDKKYNRLIDSEQRREDKRRESARNCKANERKPNKQAGPRPGIVARQAPRCTMNNVTLSEGDDGQVPDVQAANTGPQRRWPAPALLLQCLQAEGLQARPQGAGKAHTKSEARGKMRYHEAAITTDQLVSRNYPHKARVPIRRTPGSGIWPISPIGEKSTMVDFSRLLLTECQ
jgi:hypothetical protein